MGLKRQLFGEKWFLRDLVGYINLNGNTYDSINKLNWDIYQSNAGNLTYRSSDFNQCIGTSTNGAIQSNVANVGKWNICNTTSDLPFTIVARVRLTAFRANSYIASYYNFGVFAQYRLMVNTSGQVRFDRYGSNDEANRLTTFSSVSLSLNTWYTIIVTGDGSNVSIYINGVDRTGTLSSGGTYTRMTPVSRSLISMGDTAFTASRQLVGELDFLGVWVNRQFSMNDVQMFNNRRFELL